MTSQGQQLLGMPTQYQECREYRHTWQDSNVVESGYEVEQIQVCPRCGNERSRVLSLRKASYGHVTKKWAMRYRQHDYLLKRDEKGEHVTADEWGSMRMTLLGYERK